MTSKRCSALTALTEAAGACTRREFEKRKGEGNRRAMKAIVDSGKLPGLLAYLETQPAGWCSVAPREEFSSLDRSPLLKRLDDQPVWSIVCFYVAKGFRYRTNRRFA